MIVLDWTNERALDSINLPLRTEELSSRIFEFYKTIGPTMYELISCEALDYRSSQ